VSLDWDYISELNFDSGLDFFFGHCTFIKSVFSNEQKILSVKFNDALNKATEKQKERLYEHFETEQYYIGNLFPSIHWSAMFVAGFNLFEKTINDICKVVHAISGLNKGLKDESGQGIERAKVYLSKTHNITAPFSIKQWERIASFAKFRNVLSHTAGELDLTQKKHYNILEIAQREPGVRIERHDTVFETADIIVDEEFVFNSIRTYREFIEILVSEIKLKKG
jgi:hypothetical protein